MNYDVCTPIRFLTEAGTWEHRKGYTRVPRNDCSFNQYYCKDRYKRRILIRNISKHPQSQEEGFSRKRKVNNVASGRLIIQTQAVDRANRDALLTKNLCVLFLQLYAGSTVTAPNF